MFGKIKDTFLKNKVLIIVFLILVLVGWFFAVYFGIKANRAANVSECPAKMEKMHAYSIILGQSNQLARGKKSLDGLENDIRALDNGTLLTTWQNVVLGGNKQQDLNDYFDTLIDSIIFFSK